MTKNSFFVLTNKQTTFNFSVGSTMKRDLVFILIALLCGILASSVYGDESTGGDVVLDEFDMVEVNSLYNEYGGHQLDQLIFYNWDRFERDLVCEAWTPLRDSRRYDYERVGEFEEYRDKCLEIMFKNPVDRQKARQYIKYKGEYVGGPNAPKPIKCGTGYVTTFTYQGVKRRVYTKSMIRTISNHDPERANADKFRNRPRLGFTQENEL